MNDSLFLTILNEPALLAGMGALLLAFSFLLSGMEAGVFALSPLRIRQQMRAGNPRAKILHGYLSHPEKFFWTILIGNTMANFFVVTLLVAMVYHQWQRQKLLSLFLILLGVFLLFALGDLLPKVLFRQFPNRLCMLMSGPFRLIAFLLSPAVDLVSNFSHRLMGWTGGKQFTGNLFGNREELRLFMQESAAQLSSDEKMMINRVLDLQNLNVGHIVIPFSRVVTVDFETPMSEVLRVSQEQHFTRFPVWRLEGKKRRIAGLLSLRGLLYDPELDLSQPAHHYVQPALFLSENLRLEEALKRMQRSGQRLAIVLDAQREETGIIGLYDILTAIFGQVEL